MNQGVLTLTRIRFVIIIYLVYFTLLTLLDYILNTLISLSLYHQVVSDFIWFFRLKLVYDGVICVVCKNYGWLGAKSALARNLVCTHNVNLTATPRLRVSICT